MRSFPFHAYNPAKKPQPIKALHIASYGQKWADQHGQCEAHDSFGVRCIEDFTLRIWTSSQWRGVDREYVVCKRCFNGICDKKTEVLFI